MVAFGARGLLTQLVAAEVIRDEDSGEVSLLTRLLSLILEEVPVPVRSRLVVLTLVVLSRALFGELMLALVLLVAVCDFLSSDSE